MLRNFQNFIIKNKAFIIFFIVTNFLLIIFNFANNDLNSKFSVYFKTLIKPFFTICGFSFSVCMLAFLCKIVAKWILRIYAAFCLVWLVFEGFLLLNLHMPFNNIALTAILQTNPAEAGEFMQSYFNAKFLLFVIFMLLFSVWLFKHKFSTTSKVFMPFLTACFLFFVVDAMSIKNFKKRTECLNLPRLIFVLSSFERKNFFGGF